MVVLEVAQEGHSSDILDYLQPPINLDVRNIAISVQREGEMALFYKCIPKFIWEDVMPTGKLGLLLKYKGSFLDH